VTNFTKVTNAVVAVSRPGARNSFHLSARNSITLTGIHTVDLYLGDFIIDKAMTLNREGNIMRQLMLLAAALGAFLVAPVLTASTAGYCKSGARTGDMKDCKENGGTK
jgi:hypothetical protein